MQREQDLPIAQGNGLRQGIVYLEPSGFFIGVNFINHNISISSSDFRLQVELIVGNIPILIVHDLCTEAVQADRQRMRPNEDVQRVHPGKPGGWRGLSGKAFSRRKNAVQVGILKQIDDHSLDGIYADIDQPKIETKRITAGNVRRRHPDFFCNKSQIEIETEAKANEYPSIEKFVTKIYALNGMSGNVNISGSVKEVLSKTSFTRNDSSDGTVMRFTLVDDSGKVAVVVWNEKATELENALKANAHLLLVNAKVKGNQNGSVEVHVDSNTFVSVHASAVQLTKIASLTENQSVNVEGVVSAVPESKEVTTSKGETVKLTVFELKDDSGAVRVSAWRQHAEALNGLKIGDKLLLENAYVKWSFGNKMELSTRTATVASIVKV